MPGALHSHDFAADRNLMVAVQLRARGIADRRVLDAMAHIPRHEFVSERYQRQAYEDHPIPIGECQTVSQPYIVALMLQALALEPSHSVLEVGTGSGYQTAILAELVRQVYSVERHASLALDAEATLSRMGHLNVTIAVGDGTKGLPAPAPFDAIIVSAASPEIPPALINQLTEHGRMVIPVGPAEEQQLQLIRKIDGRTQVTTLEGCRFVPLISEG